MKARVKRPPLNWRDQMQKVFGTRPEAPSKQYRYEERGDVFRLQRWIGDTDTTITGYLGTQPAWLKDIIAVAKVGGLWTTVQYPPPSAILWFDTDEDNTLIKFHKLY